MGRFLEPEDLAPFAQIDAAKAREMIADAEAMAALAAPCITDPEFLLDEALAGAVRAILRGAVLRRNESGAGALTQVGAGSFQMSTDTRQPTRGLFWPSEIQQLRELCSRFNESLDDAAFMVDMRPEAPEGSLADRPDLWFQYVNPVPPGAP